MANKSRPKQLSFRVSEEEYQQLQEKISKSGKNQQEYILSCVLEKQIVNLLECLSYSTKRPLILLRIHVSLPAFFVPGIVGKLCLRLPRSKDAIRLL